MIGQKCISILTLAMLGIAFSAPPLWARGRKPPPTPPAPPVMKFSGWMVYWDVTRGTQTVTQWNSNLEEVSLFANQFEAGGKIIPSTPQVREMTSWISGHRTPGQRVLLTIVNDIGARQKDGDCVHLAIGTPEARAAHIAQLVALADNVDGIDIDYERVNAGDRENFTTFITELSQALHARQKWLSVVLQPRTASTKDNDPNGSGSIDWKAIAPYADRIKVMAYLYHYSESDAGSVAPIRSVIDLARYSLTIVPPEKLCIVLYLGGFDWPENGSGRSLEFDQAFALARAHGKTIQADALTKSGTFHYTDEKQKNHTVWIETGEGLAAKIQALAQQGVPSIAFWRFGAADPALHIEASKMTHH